MTSHNAVHDAVDDEVTDGVKDALALRDLTDPAAGPHAIQLVVAALEESLGAARHAQVRHDPGPRIVAVTDNYDRLGYRPDAVTRDRRYTRYVDDSRMLRSHTTARIPALLDQLTAESQSDTRVKTGGTTDDATDGVMDGATGRGDVLLSVPGICYRRDAIGRGHVGEPHQMDLWLIRRGGPSLDERDLDSMIALVVAAVLPGRAWRTVPSVHPYTMAGREIYVDGDSGPVEVGECGLAHPDVLGPAGTSGLAMGLGLDRLTMLAKGIDDIRLLRSTDPRISGQMNDLTRYRPVSVMPAVRRDLSVIVPSDMDTDLLGDRVRDLLGADAGAVEEVSVLSRTGYQQLPESARRRMGVREDQQNMLVRVVLRDLDRTLTATEANLLRDRIYAGLHQGEASEWASST
jgi:phenylalanyl-tRNA synthetase alpha chain